MQIAHIAIWVRDLEAMKLFYTRYFAGVSSSRYVNPAKQFESYFISFGSGASIELMHKSSVCNPRETAEQLGIAHIAFKLGSEQAVIELTETLGLMGFVLQVNHVPQAMVISKACCLMRKATRLSW